MYGKEPEFIFLDEVQEAEKMGNSGLLPVREKEILHLHNRFLFKPLGREIATQNRDRGVSTGVFPPSFWSSRQTKARCPRNRFRPNAQ
ncbi:MAG: hypothetical protein ACP5PX_00630 [Candidatus Hadarchaeum sp.]|uniref:hypothetical protein n=1 Tax=Candidatus Hadarchaeum sp. TaxID=2883567 RepID=UPI003D142D14